jgi:2-dehydro-3-deoxyphosphogluconate aldolase/(4S)-4-hydroxy-2-oxoglutarate aldolase
MVPSGIIAVIRAGNAQEAETIGLGLAAAGVNGVEITFTVPNAVDVIAALRSATDMPIGAGTVRSVADARAAVTAGATFIVSPDLDTSVVAEAHRLGVAAVPGALTPTEVGRCLAVGADGIKLFPIGAVNGPSYVRALAEPFPETPWVVSGGVKIEDVTDYLHAGCHAVCIGGVLIDRIAATAGDVAGVERYARLALDRRAQIRT